MGANRNEQATSFEQKISWRVGEMACAPERLAPEALCVGGFRCILGGSH